MSEREHRAVVVEPKAAPMAAVGIAQHVPTPVIAEGTRPTAQRYETEATIVAPRRARVWPWLIGAALVAGAGIAGYALYANRQERAAFDARYPILVSSDDAAALDREVDRWNRGKAKLLATLATFQPPAVETMTGAGACPLAIEGPLSNDPDLHTRSADPDAELTTRMILLPQESFGTLDTLVRPEIEAIVAAAERGRFQTREGHDHVLSAIRGGVLVVQLTELTPASAAGAAYAFDPGTGQLRCAGTFRSESSNLHELDAETERAIARSLRAID